MSEKPTAENDVVEDDIDWSSVFPTGRIKAQVMNDDRVGRVSNKAAEYVGACSALFLQSLASEAIENSSGGSIVTLDHVRQAATKHDILDVSALEGLTEQSAPQRPRKKKPKLDSTVKASAVQEAMVVSAATAVATFRPEITVDDDDYD